MNKKIITLVVCILIIAIIAIALIITNGIKNQNLAENNSQREMSEVTKEQKNNNILDNKKVAVIYFSATGTTKSVAEKLSKVANADLIEIEPKDKYTSEDLDYNNDNCRANQEQNDKNARPEIISSINTDKYDAIFLGYPIWWGTNPRIIQTFLDTHNLSGKTIIPFCTSGGSGISTSENDLKIEYSNIKWLSGKRFTRSTTEEELKTWVYGLNY